jgi:hypothetical protein
MDDATFTKLLRDLDCSDEVIAELRGDRTVYDVHSSTRRPTKAEESGWEQIQPPSGAHGSALTYWYNAKQCRFWVKVRGG